MRAESLEFLKAIVNAPSPSGYEQPAAKVYRDYTQPFADRVTTDVHGNVAAVLNPDAAMKVMLAGHMDEIGFIIHHIIDEGLIYFKGIGGHDSVIPVGQRVWIHGRERVAGIIGPRPSISRRRTTARRNPNSRTSGLISGPPHGPKSRP